MGGFYREVGHPSREVTTRIKKQLENHETCLWVTVLAPIILGGVGTNETYGNLNGIITTRLLGPINLSRLTILNPHKIIHGQNAKNKTRKDKIPKQLIQFTIIFQNVPILILIMRKSLTYDIFFVVVLAAGWAGYPLSIGTGE